MNKLFVLIISLMMLTSAKAQSARNLNNDGVDLYKDGKFTDAEVNFKKSLEKSKDNFKMNFNLGDAYYKQQRYDDALQSYQNALTQSDDKIDKAKVYHNIGNSLLKSKKIQESVEAYKNSLKLNPNDDETKYNLSYALSLLNKDKDKNKQNQKNKDKNQKDQNKKDQDKNDKNKDQQNKDQQNKNKDDEKNKDEQNKHDQKNQNKPDQNEQSKQDNLKQPEKNKISKEEAERILNALKNNEKDLQKKIRKKAGTPVKTDKDW